MWPEWEEPLLVVGCWGSSSCAKSFVGIELSAKVSGLWLWPGYGINLDSKFSSKPHNQKYAGLIDHKFVANPVSADMGMSLEHHFPQWHVCCYRQAPYDTLIGSPSVAHKVPTYYIYIISTVLISMHQPQSKQVAHHPSLKNKKYIGSSQVQGKTTSMDTSLKLMTVFCLFNMSFIM